MTIARHRHRVYRARRRRCVYPVVCSTRRSGAFSRCVSKLPLVKATRQSDIGKEKPGIALPVWQRAGEGGISNRWPPCKREQRFSRLPPFDFSGLHRGSLRSLLHRARVPATVLIRLPGSRSGTCQWRPSVRVIGQYEESRPSSRPQACRIAGVQGYDRDHHHAGRICNHRSTPRSFWGDPGRRSCDRGRHHQGDGTVCRNRAEISRSASSVTALSC